MQGLFESLYSVTAAQASCVFPPPVRLEGIPSYTATRMGERRRKEGRKEGNIYLCEMRCGALRPFVRPFVQWAATTAELPRSREKSGQRHQIKSRPRRPRDGQGEKLVPSYGESVMLKFSNES